MTTKNTTPRSRTNSPLNEALPQIRLGARSGKFVLDSLSQEDTPWYESQEDIETALEESRKRRQLIETLMPIMRECLTDDELEAMHLYFLHAKTYRQVGVIMDRNASTILRYVHRSIEKIRDHLGVSGDGEIPFMK